MYEYLYFSVQIAGIENDDLQVLSIYNNTAGEQYLNDILHLLKCESSGQFKYDVSSAHKLSYLKRKKMWKTVSRIVPFKSMS